MAVAGGVEGVSAASPGGSVSVNGGLIKMPQFRYIQWYKWVGHSFWRDFSQPYGGGLVGYDKREGKAHHPQGR